MMKAALDRTRMQVQTMGHINMDWWWWVYLDYSVISGLFVSCQLSWTVKKEIEMRPLLGDRPGPDRSLTISLWTCHGFKFLVKFENKRQIIICKIRFKLLPRHIVGCWILLHGRHGRVLHRNHPHVGSD